MSLLQQNSPELDDAARGEELTRGTSHVVLATVTATVLVTIAIVVYALASQKPLAASGEIIQMWAHPVHNTTTGFDANGAAMAKESFDQVLVFAQIRLKNQSQTPLYLRSIQTNTTLDDAIHSSYAASTPDYERVFIAYPELTALRGTALSPEVTLAPGQSQEGTIVSAFRISKQQWDARKDLNLTFNFRYQPSLVLTPHVAITEQ
jgi:hypothetical protein